MKIAITGGKGGTGKTIIAVNLAIALLKLGKKVTYLDCDADCPSAHLILGAELKNKKEVSSFIPKINQEKCIKCGKCMKSCEYNSLYQIKGNPPILLPLICSGCKTCKIVCPSGAIEDDKKVIGWTYKTKIKGIELFSGELKPSDPLSEKVISAIKKRGNNEGTGEIFIIDTSAGAHCPVVAALEDCDRAIAVTEPTLFGEHDLKIIIKVLDKMKIPYNILVNKSNISKKKIKGSALEIPYDKKMLECYVEGIPIIEKYPKHQISEKILKFAKEVLKK
ncbi:MAG: P-loop NTPase [Candidatus Micrarchaeia archaeon]|jgi:MinD superfamily P-loop ATPase